MKRSDINAVYRRLAEANPNPKSELDHTNPFTLLVAVVLSAQSTDKGVNKATSGLFQVADTPGKMVELGESQLKNYVKTIGLYNNKAKNIMSLSHIIVAEHKGEVPQNRAALEALPGVGRKTANVVLNIAFGQPVIAVDTHIFRVANRTGLATGKTPLDVEKKLEKLTVVKWKQHAHHWLVLHGRYVCKARKPLCGECRIIDLCGFKGKITFEGGPLR